MWAWGAPNANWPLCLLLLDLRLVFKTRILKGNLSSKAVGRMNAIWAHRNICAINSYIFRQIVFVSVKKSRE